MRILYLPSWYPRADHPTYGIFLRGQAAALAKRHRVVVVPVPETTSLLRRPWRCRNRCQTRHGPAGLVELSLSGPNYTPGAPNAHERIVWRLYRRGFDEAVRVFGAPPDLIHAQVALEAGYFGARLAAKYHVPLVLTEHISRPDLLMRTPRNRERALYAMHAAACMLGVSPPQRRLLQEAGVRREIDVVPNPIDTELFSPGRPAPAPPPVRLITVGHLIARKGVDNLLRAVARITGSDPIGLEVDIVGRGELRRALQSTAVSLGLGARVRFHGEQLPRQVRDLLRQSHIYACASLTESFGIAVAEAMSVGLPVVVTESGGPESYVTEAQGAVVRPGSIEELVHGIRDVVHRLGTFDHQRQRQYILDRFSEATVVSEIEKHYRLALECPRRQDGRAGDQERGADG